MGNHRRLLAEHDDDDASNYESARTEAPVDFHHGKQTDRVH